MNKIKEDIGEAYQNYMMNILHLNSLEDNSEILKIIIQTRTNIIDFNEDNDTI